MTFYLVVGVIALVLLPVAYRRSGSMTRYRVVTGAPLVWVLLAAASAGAVIAYLAGDPSLAQGVFSGGLLGTAFAQIVLLRRGLGEARGPSQDGPERR